MKDSALLAGAAKAASYNMILQFSLRITTFVLNAFILRHVSQEILGVVNVRLTLLYSTSLFLAKEAFEKACLSKAEKRNWTQVVNLLWCTFPLAVVCSGLLSLVWIFLLEVPFVAGYPFGVICFALSCTFEVLAEPLFVIGQSFMFVKLKVLILGFSQALKCLITVSLIYLNPQGGILNFCVAQICSSLVYTLTYYLFFMKYIHRNQKKDEDFPLRELKDIFPQRQPDKPFIDVQMASLTWSFFKQSFLKQILTEGEKYVMTFFDVLSFSDQGIYDVINNLGSLAARFIFLPVEENSYLFFSLVMTRGEPAEKQNQDSLHLCAKVLGVVLKLVSLIGVIIVVFGFSNSYLALQLYGGSALTDGIGPTLLRWYCLYVLVIAVNGTTEAFVFAAMTKEDVDRYNHKMVLLSGLFLFSSWFLTSVIGSVGFILANCLNMMARIIHSIIYIWHYFKTTDCNPLKNAVPSLAVCISLSISFIITYFSEAMLCNVESEILHKLAHIGISAVCLLMVIISVLVAEKSLVNTVIEQMRRTKEHSVKEKSS